MKKAITILLSMLMILSFAGCSGNSSGQTGAAPTGGAASTEGSAASGDAFKLGAFLQLTGGNAAVGIEARNSIQMAVKEINSEGGLNGQQIQLIVYDTQGVAEQAVKVVSKLVQVDKVDFCIGSVNSAEVLAAGGILNDAGITTIGLGTSATWMKKDWPCVFRCAKNNSRAPMTTADMVKELGLTSISIFKGQDDDSLGAANIFKTECGKRGISVLAEESYDLGDTDFSAQITKLIKSNSQAVYIAVNGETGPVIMKQLRQYGYKGLVFDKESFMYSQIAIAGKDNANYIAFANPYVTYAKAEDCDISNVREFLEKYTKAYGSCAQTDSAYRGWDAMLVLKEAAKIAKSNKTDALKNGITQIKGLKGLGGTIDFTKGDREGYAKTNKFILVDSKNVEFDKWIKDGGYEKYKKATGRKY